MTRAEDYGAVRNVCRCPEAWNATAAAARNSYLTYFNFHNPDKDLTAGTKYSCLGLID